MELTIKVVKILPMQSFVSKRSGEEMHKYAFVGTTTNERFERTVCFFAFGDVWTSANVCVGSTYEVSFDVSSREYNERWYTECACWKISAVANAQTPTPAQQQSPIAQPAAPANNDDANGLPF